MNTIETLDTSPFKRLVLTIGALPTAFMDSMTYYEALAWLVDYIQNKIVPAVDNNAEALQELEDYVTHYFDNLDIQEEINKKLDAMAEDGTLAEIINQEIFGDLNDAVAQNTQDIQTNASAITALTKAENAKTDFYNITMAQSMIYDTNVTKSMQGACIDENNVLYQYVSREDNTGYGDIYKFNPTTHVYVDTIADVKMYHGNSLTYLNGDIYAVAFKDESDNPSIKLIKYTISNGTITELNPFTTTGCVQLVSVCKYDNNNLLVCMRTSDSSYHLDYWRFYKYNINTSAVTEISFTYGNMYIAGAVPVEMDIVDGKLYILCDGWKSLYECIIVDDENHHNITISKTHHIGNLDEIGLRLGEFENLSMFPSNFYGDGVLMLGSYLGNTTDTTSTFMYHLISLKDNIKPFYGALDTSNNAMHVQRVYVRKTTNPTVLLENGNTDFPFKRLERAIEFLNNNVAGKNYRDIQIEDNDTYYVPECGNKTIPVFWGNYTPTINLMGDLRECNVWLHGSGNATIGGKSPIDFTASRVCITSGTITKQIRFNQGCDAGIYNTAINISPSVDNAIKCYLTRLSIFLASATGYTNKIAIGYQGSLILADATSAPNCSAGSGAGSALITGS